MVILVSVTCIWFDILLNNNHCYHHYQFTVHCLYSVGLYYIFYNLYIFHINIMLLQGTDLHTIMAACSAPEMKIMTGVVSTVPRCVLVPGGITTVITPI